MEYKVIGKTKKYQIVSIMGAHRIELLNGELTKLIPYVEIPKCLADELVDILESYKDADKGEKKIAKAEGVTAFEEKCDIVYAHEWDVLDDTTD